jgi:hypothetical protein
MSTFSAILLLSIVGFAAWLAAGDIDTTDAATIAVLAFVAGWHCNTLYHGDDDE